MVAVVPAGHRLARRRRLAPQDFAGEDFVSLSPGASSRHRIDEVFVEAGVRRRLRIETPLSEILCGIVASGAAVGIADIFTAREYEGTGLVVRPFEPPVTFSMLISLSPCASVPDADTVADPPLTPSVN